MKSCLFIFLLFHTPVSYSADLPEGMLDYLNTLESPASFEEACETGELRSCHLAGIMYQQGISVEPDIETAIRYFRVSCDAGEADKCTAIGYIYSEGEFAEQDYLKAAEYYETACLTDPATSCDDITTMNLYGLGIPQSFSKAAEYLGMSCEAHNPQSCSFLTAMYSSGSAGEFKNAIAPDHALALQYALKACELDDGYSCGVAAAIHAEAAVVDADPETALSFAEKGCLLESQYSCSLIGKLMEDL